MTKLKLSNLSKSYLSKWRRLGYTAWTLHYKDNIYGFWQLNSYRTLGHIKWTLMQMGDDVVFANSMIYDQDVANAVDLWDKSEFISISPKEFLREVLRGML